MISSLGMVELNSIAKGIETTDAMLKSANIELLYSKHICPGKYIIVVSGDTEAVKLSVDRGLTVGQKNIIASFVLSNIHEDIINGLKRKFNYPVIRAIGVVEFTSAAEGLISLDKVLKYGNVSLVKLLMGSGIGGKCYFVITGDLSSVEEGLRFGMDGVKMKKLVNKAIIPYPDDELIKNL